MCGDGDEDNLLVRYLLDDVAPAEADAVRTRLGSDPAYAERLAELARCLDAQRSAAEEPAPPTDLADRTAHAVLAMTADRVGACVGRKRFSLIDLTATAVAATLLGAIALPAVQSAHDGAQRIACEGNLRELFRSFEHYRGANADRLPEIGPRDNAGLFSVALAESGVVTRERLAETLVCPSSELAEHVAAHRASVVVPTRAELPIAWPLVLDRVQRFMGGSYAYRFGYIEADGDYVWPASRADCRAPLLADSPARDGSGEPTGANHGGCGQNVLFEDGHVEFLSECWTPGLGNHLFLNNRGEVAAGTGPADFVLAPSEATPGAVRVVRVLYR